MKIKPFNSLFAIALAVVAVLGMASCNEKKFHVNGTIGNAADSTLYFENMSLNGPVVIDSVKLSADGTFDFVAKPKVKPQSQLIKKLAHGRVSKTKDEAIQLTLKVYCDEGENIAEAIYKEAAIAKDAIVAFQMKR